MISASGRLLPNDGSLAPIDTTLAAYVKTLEAAYSQSLDDTIAILKEPMFNYPSDDENNLGRWVTDAYRKAVGADVAFRNPGGLRKTINAGAVTRREIWEASPFGNSMIIFELTGAELQIIMQHLASKPREHLLVSGLTTTLDLKNMKATKLLVNNQQIEPEKKYKAITISYIIIHFEGYFGIPIRERFLYDTGIIDREMLINVAKEEETIIPPANRRITYLR
ncbi:MAG: 5'-nucleotidase [Candidatus Hatepunaea meridiana]|nr:5'-nucleotidase [Candidatus Hatepunaea meridiana]